MPTGDRGYRTRRRLSRLRRWLPQIACLVVALGVFIAMIATDADEDPGNLWMIATVPLWISVFTGHVWRRIPLMPDGLEALVVRRRVRRIVWRAALILIFAAFALLWVASFWHWRASISEDYPTVDQDAGHYAFFAGLWWWPLVGAAALVVVEPFLFLFAPDPVRDALRRARALQATDRRLGANRLR
ncbi:MAG TPA: hypothetical protein VGX23_00630 [Actinocrinis sp.]|nr:hypothetical protein [Actinocrinis sp.]